MIKCIKFRDSFVLNLSHIYLNYCFSMTKLSFYTLQRKKKHLSYSNNRNTITTRKQTITFQILAWANYGH